MPNIVVNSCPKTSNITAIDAVSIFCFLNRQQDYLYNREIMLTGDIFIVNERHTEEDKLGCDCSFQVTFKG